MRGTKPVIGESLKKRLSRTPGLKPARERRLIAGLKPRASTVAIF